MGEGLRLVNEIYARAKIQHGVSQDVYFGINTAILVLSEPVNDDLLKRLVDYCGSDEASKEEHDG